jgi:hypothetical protein
VDDIIGEKRLGDASMIRDVPRAGDANAGTKLQVSFPHGVVVPAAGIIAGVPTVLVDAGEGVVGACGVFVHPATMTAAMQTASKRLCLKSMSISSLPKIKNPVKASYG